MDLCISLFVSDNSWYQLFNMELCKEMFKVELVTFWSVCLVCILSSSSYIGGLHSWGRESTTDYIFTPCVVTFTWSGIEHKMQGKCECSTNWAMSPLSVWMVLLIDFATFGVHQNATKSPRGFAVKFLTKHLNQEVTRLKLGNDM